MKNRVLLVILALSSFAGLAQNVNFQVQVSYLGWDGRGDQAGGSEYGLFVWGRDNVNATEVGGQCFYTGDVGNGGGGVSSTVGGSLYGQSVALNAQNNSTATQVLIHFRGYEKDCSNNCTYQSGCNCVFGLCATEDDDYIDNTNAQTITFRDPTSLCQWKDWGIIQVGSFYYQVRVYWEYATIPAGTISSAQSLCQGATATALSSNAAALAGVNYVWQTGPTSNGPFTSTTQTNPASFAPGPIGSDTYFQLTATTQGCAGSTATPSNVIGITISPVPSNVAATGIASRCQGSGTDAFIGSGTNATSYTWAVSPSGVGTVDNAGVVTWDTAFSGVATINTTADNNGCGAVVGSTSVLVNPRPAVTISNLANAYCQDNAAVSLSGVPSGGSFTVDGSPAVSLDPATVAGTTATVVYSYTDISTTCSNTATRQVTINPSPVVSFTGLSVTHCLNSVAIPLTGTPAGGTFSGNGVVGSNFNPPLSGLGQAAITYEFTDSNGCIGSEDQTTTVASVASTVNLGNDTVICNNLTLTLDAGANYVSYTWSNTQTTQSITIGSAGIYTVDAVDATGCINNDQIFVNTGDILNPIITSTNALTTFCEGDTLILSSVGQYATYLWSDGQTTTNTLNVTVPGTYTLFATDVSGCSGQSTPVNTSMFPAPSTTIISSGPPSFCPGDDVILCGPVGNLQYQWNSGETTQCLTINNAGTHILTVSDQNGCSATSATIQTQVFTIVNPIITVNGPTEFCIGGSVELCVQDAFASYLWNSGSTTPCVTATQSGNYSIVVLDLNGCIDSILTTTPVNVTVGNPYPQVTVNGNELTSTQTFATYQWYEWQNATTSVLLPGETGPTLTIEYSSWYYLQATDDNFCRGYSDTFFIDYKSGIGFEELFADGISIFPNPSEDYVEVSFINPATSPLSIYLTDLTGRRIKDFLVEDKTLVKNHKLDIQDLSSGAYLLCIENGRQRIIRKIARK